MNVYVHVFDEILSYGRITFHFRIRVLSHPRWLFCHCSVYLPDARGNMLLNDNGDNIIVRYH